MSQVLVVITDNNGNRESANVYYASYLLVDAPAGMTPDDIQKQVESFLRQPDPGTDLTYGETLCVEEAEEMARHLSTMLGPTIVFAEEQNNIAFALTD